jgi:hypothetical protein
LTEFLAQTTVEECKGTILNTYIFTVFRRRRDREEAFFHALAKKEKKD